VDEFGKLLVIVGRGWARSVALPDGKPIQETSLTPAGSVLTAWQAESGRPHWLAGTQDGQVVAGTWEFEVSHPSLDSLPGGLRTLPLGESAIWEDGVITRVEAQQYRWVRGRPQFQEPLRVASAPLVLVDGLRRGNADVVVAVDQSGNLYTYSVVYQRNLLTGKTTPRASGGQVLLDRSKREGLPRWLFLKGQGDMVLVVWPSGRFQRFDITQPASPALVEEGSFRRGESGRLLTGTFLLGRHTLIFAHEDGSLAAWFLAPTGARADGEGRVFVCGHHFGRKASSPLQLAAAQRSRLVAVAYQDSSVEIYHTTSERRMLVWQRAGRQDIRALAFAPKDDLLVLASSGGIELAALKLPHPEVSWRTIWGRVWYEGYPRPAFVWQSTGGTDDFEPKYGLVPLVFGTLKATFYSLLFGLPLAILAAIYTSEFLHRRWRNRIKPTIELMASLPSVVLGFIAAFVVAPLVERRVPELLCFFGTLPLTLLAGGHLWEMLPTGWRSAGWLRMTAVLAAAVVAGWLAGQIGPVVELVLFDGDLKGWLAQSHGKPWGGWVILWIPLGAFAVTWINVQWLSPPLYRLWPVQSRWGAALLRLAKLGLCVLLVGVIAFLGAWVCTQLLGDPRGNLLGTYVQRNALVVGIIMGFAIIPIIFTLAEDALSAVPQELRAASLGAGATPWQTAIWVVIPTAMSGLFSAAMIGLGRAAGETMIVLMAAGNTPIMEWNPFNGFRTLSANIAVELPEAVQNSTHYRMLFLAALCLFVLTSVINTVAEIVRLRFRKQATHL
jgi:phosphate transport system permease protein